MTDLQAAVVAAQLFPRILPTDQIMITERWITGGHHSWILSIRSPTNIWKEIWDSNSPERLPADLVLHWLDQLRLAASPSSGVLP